MGDANHLLYVERYKAEFLGPYLEVGSRDYGNTQRIRDLFPGESYLGIDLSAGDGVDHVMDLTLPFEQVDAQLDGQRFGTVFCISVLEHCDQPFAMADNITRLLAPDGKVYVSVPFAWRFHAFPNDFWRFTHEGIKKLFPRIEFDQKLCFARTDMLDDFRPLDKDLCRLRVTGTWLRRRGQPLAALGGDLLRLLGALGPLRWLTRHRYLMPPTMIEMTGRLREPDRESD